MGLKQRAQLSCPSGVWSPQPGIQYAQIPNLENLGKVAVVIRNPCHHGPPTSSYEQQAEVKIPARGRAVAYGKAKHSLLLQWTWWRGSDRHLPAMEAAALIPASEAPVVCMAELGPAHLLGQPLEG